MKTSVIILLLLLLLEYPDSQINPNCNYLPLKVGNSWTYYYSNSSSGAYRGKLTVISSIIVNGHKYYNFSNGSNFFRIDSTKANYLMYTTTGGCSWSPNEKLYDSLAASLNDTVRIDCGTSYVVLTSQTTVNIFGQNRVKKIFRSNPSNGREYLQGIGVYGAYGGGGTSYWAQSLLGCVLDGVVYGDTSLVGIELISTEIPQLYNLYQNYPNPFNPTTKIRFSIPPYQVGQGDRLVILKIYDVLGKEIATIVNEQLNPGTYEVEWNAEDYPSGIYFYTLITNTFSQTNKMVIIK
jgi:hypothetical protein